MSTIARMRLILVAFAVVIWITLRAFPTAPVPDAATAATRDAARLCQTARVSFRTDYLHRNVDLMVADTPTQRAIGLSNSDQPGPEAGLLVRYDTPQPDRGFLRDAGLAVDVILFDQAGTVLRLSPHPGPPIIDAAGVAFAAHLGAGGIEALGLTEASLFLGGECLDYEDPK